MQANIFAVLIVINLLLRIDSSHTQSEYFDELENNFDDIPKSHQGSISRQHANDNGDEGDDGNERNSQNNPSRYDEYRKSMFDFDWMNRIPLIGKSQASAIKRDVWNKTATINSQWNDKDLSNVLINKTSTDAIAAKVPNLSASSNNRNSIGVGAENKLDDLKAILTEIYEELDTIKAAKMCSDKDPDGNDCDVSGAWNAAKIGLRIELSTSQTASDGNKLAVNLAEKIPKKQATSSRIDATWKCTGSIVHKNGGPFYFHCLHPQSPQSMSIFHGVCKKCSGFDTIFGEWIFQHIPGDCRQIWTYSETKRDVFHKILMHHSSDNTSSNQTTLDSMSKNNDTFKSKPEKFRRNSKHPKYYYYVPHTIDQDLFNENLN